MKEYDDIINLPHFEPKYHTRMSIYNRSAQFAPFAALTGYNEAIVETARLTDKKIEVDDYVKDNLNMDLQIINDHIKENITVSILYFKKDNKKDGGKYLEYTDNVKKIDLINREIVFCSGVRIKLDDLIKISYDL